MDTSRISRKSRLQARARATFHIPDHGPSGSGIPFPPPNWIVARRGGPPANTRPGASSARAFVRDGLTSHPIASRPDPTRGGGVPTAAPPRASSRRTNLASRHVSNHVRSFGTHPPPGEARVHSARRRGRARRGAHLLLDGDTHTLNARLANLSKIDS